MRGAVTVLEAVRLSEEYLRRRGVDSPRLSAEHLLAKALGCSRLDLYLRSREALAAKVLDPLRGDLRRRAERFPLQYILGRVEFCSLPFAVAEGVFIPRPETELLVECSAQLAAGRERARFVEFGTGSGVIAAALAAARPGWTGVAFDVSPAAAALAARNLRALGLGGRVDVLACDGFSAICGDAAFDLVVANPPYIACGEIDGLQAEVSRWENRTALDGGADGLRFYEPIAAAGCRLLRPGGALALEIGLGQAAAVGKILSGLGYTAIETRRDYNRIERIVSARRPGEVDI